MGAININKKPAVIQIMAWHHRCDKPLPEPMMVQFTYKFMRHFASIIYQYWLIDKHRIYTFQ